MIQIAFESAFDPFHAAFRMVRLLKFSDEPIAIARLKILDVYLAEPRRSLEIRLTGPAKKAATVAATYQPPTYGRRPSTFSFFNRMSPMQDAAIQTLVMRGVVEGDLFARGVAGLSEFELPSDLEARVIEANEAQKPLMAFLCQTLDAIPFDGKNGLKQRTGLGEYRYDLV